MKNELKKIAVQLRRDGKSYAEINNVTRVSKSTLSLWLRDVMMPADKKFSLRERHLQRIRVHAGKAQHAKKLRNAEYTVRESWKDFAAHITDPFFMLGLGLYWAEGSKTYQHFCFTNSDPAMMKIFMSWVRKYLKPPEQKFKVQLNIHSLHSRQDAEDFWSKITNIPRIQFMKTFIKPTSLKHRKNINYNGTCAVRVQDVNAFRTYLGWQFAMLEHYKVLEFSLQQREKMINTIINNLGPRNLMDKVALF